MLCSSYGRVIYNRCDSIDYEPCPSCGGNNVVSSGLECHRCNGTGLISYVRCQGGEDLCYTYHASKSIECWRSKKGTQIFHRVPFLIHFWCLLLQNTSHCHPSCDFSRLLFIKYKGNNASSEAVWWFLILNLSLDCFFWYVTCTAYRLSVCP